MTIHNIVDLPIDSMVILWLSIAMLVITRGYRSVWLKAYHSSTEPTGAVLPGWHRLRVGSWHLGGWLEGGRSGDGTGGFCSWKWPYVGWLMYDDVCCMLYILYIIYYILLYIYIFYDIHIWSCSYTYIYIYREIHIYIYGFPNINLVIRTSIISHIYHHGPNNCGHSD